MGYTRQSIALGFVMLGMVAIQKSRFKSFIFWVVLGAAFHKTAVFILPLAALISTRRRIQKIGLVGLASAVGYELFLSSHGQRLYDGYIEMHLVDSDGAFIRLLMNAIPGALYVFLFKRLNISETERSFWKYVSWISLLMLVMLFTFGFSTALDRMALYFIPLQLVVSSYLPSVLKGRKETWIFLIIAYYGLILLVWINFAKHARYWLPYQIGFG